MAADPDLLLGDLVEVLVRSRRGLEVFVIDDGHSLTWDPRRERLHSVRVGRRLGPAHGEAAEMVQAFHWKSTGADLVDTVRPTGRRRARQIGALAAIVYRCAKSGDTLEYSHEFIDPPIASWDGQEWYFIGRVLVDERGIIS